METSGTGKGKYTEKDAARDTGVSEKEVNRAWHQARDDAMRSGERRSSATVSHAFVFVFQCACAYCLQAG